MFKMNNGYHFLDMHMLWWLFWIVFVAMILRLRTRPQEEGRQGRLTW